MAKVPIRCSESLIHHRGDRRLLLAVVIQDRSVSSNSRPGRSKLAAEAMVQREAMGEAGGTEWLKKLNFGTTAMKAMAGANRDEAEECSECAFSILGADWRAGLLGTVVRWTRARPFGTWPSNRGCWTLGWPKRVGGGDGPGVCPPPPKPLPGPSGIS